MGEHTDAILLYGIDFGIDVPWAEEKYNFDWKDWWTEVGEGEIPVDIVTHCSNEVPAYIVSVKGTQRKARRGYPLKIEWEQLQYECFREHVSPYLLFIAKYCIPDIVLDNEVLGKSSWLLCSYWG